MKNKNWFSLANKLTVLMTLSIAVILVGFCFYIYPSFNNLSLEVGRAQELQQLLQQKHLSDTLGPLAAPFDGTISMVCIKKVITAMIAFIILTCLVSYLIAERTMQKVKSLASTLQKIDSNELTKRLDPREWPSELRDVIEPFNHMLQRLETSFVTLSQFSSDIAHELRTPLHNLQSLTEVTLTKDRSISEYQTRLYEFGEELAKMSRLTESLLFLARIENNQEVLNVQWISLAKLIKKIVEFFSASIAEKNLKVSVDGDALVLLDALLFERVITNLLSNAIRYTPNDGKILFHISIDEDKIVHCMVQDTGPGIPDEHLPHIFQRFYRADYSRSESDGGNGLGLAISQAIVDLHGGRMAVASETGVGSCFTITFPLT